MDTDAHHHPHEPRNPFFERWGRLVVDYRWWVIGATLGVVAMVSSNAQDQTLDTSIEAFTNAESETSQTLEEYRDEFGRDNLFAVVAEGDVFSEAYLRKLSALHQVLETMEMELSSLDCRKKIQEPNTSSTKKTAAPIDEFGDMGDFDVSEGDSDDGTSSEDQEVFEGEQLGIFTEVSSLLNARKVRETEFGGVDFGELLTPFPARKDLPRLRDEVLNDPALLGQLVGPKATHSAIALRTCKMNDEDSSLVYLEVQKWVENFSELSSLPGMDDTALVELWSMGFRSLEAIADAPLEAFLAQVRTFNALRTVEGIQAAHLNALRQADLKTVEQIADTPVDTLRSILAEAGQGGDRHAERIRTESEVLVKNRSAGQAWPEQVKLDYAALQTMHSAAQTAKDAKQAGQDVTDQDFQILVSGLPALNAVLSFFIMGDLAKMLIASMAVMFIILLYLFRHPLGVFPPLLVVFASAMTTVGTMVLVGYKMTMLTTIIPAFLFCVGIGHSVHLISVYRDSLADGVEPREAVVHAVATTGLPIFYTSLTTMIGLLSFHFASLNAINEMGYAGAFGVFVAFVLSITLLPAMMSFNKKGRFGRVTRDKTDLIDRLLNVCLGSSGQVDGPTDGPEPDFARRRRYRNLVVMTAIILLCIPGIQSLKVWHNPLEWLPEDTPIKVAFDAMDENIGGTANVQILVDGTTENGVKDLALLQGLDRLEQHIRAYEDPTLGPIVGNSVSLATILKELNQAYHGNDPAYYRLPDTQAGASQLIQTFENSGKENMEKIVVGDLSRTQVTIRIKWLEATSYLGLTEYIQEGIDEHIPDTAIARPTGSVYSLVSTIGQLVKDLIASFGVAFILITLIMMALLRSIKLGLIAMVPNLLPIATIMSIMSVVDIPIDMNTLLIASISIGLAVDDTIHLLHHFKVNYEDTGDLELSLRRAMSHSGRAIISTSIILTLGFFCFMAADMLNVFRFGFLVGLTAMLALLIDLFFSPALIRTFYERRAQPSEVTDESISA